LTRKINVIQETLKDIDDIESFTRETSLTDSDFDRLRNGKLLTQESRSKLSDLPDELKEAHQIVRRNIVETLCMEIREAGFSEPELQRFSALLKAHIPAKQSEFETAFAVIENLRKTLK